MPLPTFIIAGVQKAGTTSIYDYLKEHPQVYTSPVKEPNFLERDWDQFYAEGGARREGRIDTFEKYQALFDGVTNEIAIGEASNNCLFHHEQSIPCIQRYVPGAKLFFVLRHPAERAHSDYLMHIRDCINPEKEASLSEQIRERAATSFVVRKGFYYDGIKHFLDVFGPDQVRVLLHDDLKQDPMKFMQTMFQELGVAPNVEPNVSKRSQKAQVPKNQAVNNFLRTKNPVRSAVASGLKLVMPVEARQKLRDRLISMNSSGKSAAPLSAEDRARLIALYRDDILKLQELIERDLSDWLV